MGKNNTDARATLLQRVDHLEEWKTETQAVIEREGTNIKALHDKIRVLHERLALLEATDSATTNMTLGQRLYWLIRGRR